MLSKLHGVVLTQLKDSAKTERSKTTLAISFLKQYQDGHPCYLNWDNELSRKIIQKNEWAKVGNLLSYKSLAEDLEVSDKTVKRWVQILDSLYYCYFI